MSDLTRGPSPMDSVESLSALARPIPKTVVVIPARYASTRFPGKPLANQTGQPLVWHVVENVRKARHPAAVIVATDDTRIAEAVRALGGTAIMTRADHPSGTDRVAEIAADLSDEVELIVNVQGDEPTLPPDDIDRLIERLAEDPLADMATLASPFAAVTDIDNPDRVKVVVTSQNRALYFSRAVIPHVRGGLPPEVPLARMPYRLHLGVYAYRRDFLLRLAALPPSPLEQLEQLEQLRVLENGGTIAVETVSFTGGGIDTPEQYQAFVAAMTASPDGVSPGDVSR